jgi:hypothetical protein
MRTRKSRRAPLDPWKYELLNKQSNDSTEFRRAPPNKDVALDRAGITAFRDITFLAGGPAGERSRSTEEVRVKEDRYAFADDGCIVARKWVTVWMPRKGEP